MCIYVCTMKCINNKIQGEVLIQKFIVDFKGELANTTFF